MKTNFGEMLAFSDVWSTPPNARSNGLGQRVSVSVVLPACDDVLRVKRIAQRIRAAQAPQLLVEVVVVDVGIAGTRGDNEHLMEFVDVYQRKPRQNKLTAVQKGVASAMGEVVLIWNVESECDPANFPRVIESILQGEADVVIGRPLVEAVRLQPHQSMSRSKVCSAMRVDVLEELTLDELWEPQLTSHLERKWRISEVFIGRHESSRATFRQTHSNQMQGRREPSTWRDVFDVAP